MVDHLLPPGMIRDVLANPPTQDEITLAVDHDTENVFDLPDLTKVEVSGGRIAAIGKGLVTWNAGDTGLFYCSSRLFEGLARAHERGEFSFTDGIRECAAQRGVRTIDVTGERWLDVDHPEAFQEAVHQIDSAMAKGGADGFISQYINRPLSRCLSVALSKTPLTPNHITLVSFFIGLLGAVGLARTDPWFWIAGGILIQIASIVDGCDGEIARVKLLEGPQGAWLDSVLDRYSDLAVGLAVTFAASQLHDARWVWPAGFAATASFLMASYVHQGIRASVSTTVSQRSHKQAQAPRSSNPRHRSRCGSGAPACGAAGHRVTDSPCRVSNTRVWPAYHSLAPSIACADTEPVNASETLLGIN